VAGVLPAPFIIPFAFDYASFSKLACQYCRTDTALQVRLRSNSSNDAQFLAGMLTAFAEVMLRKKTKGGESMNLLKRLMTEEDGQGLVEYALIVLLVVFVFWMAIKGTNIGNQLANGWSKIGSCLANPTGCS
jgi:Flp pilus assembly pilin Flp